MHPERKLVEDIVNKYKFKGWLPVGSTTNNIKVEIYRLYDMKSYRVVIKDNLKWLIYPTLQEVQETMFNDILNPTQNELVIFELAYGFEWPLQDKFRLTNLSYCHV